jgi:hypothetical protein
LRSGSASADYQASVESGEGVGSEQQEFVHGVKLAVIAAVSAAVTATAVIGAGRALLPAPDAVAAPAPALIPASDRRP